MQKEFSFLISSPKHYDIKGDLDDLLVDHIETTSDERSKKISVDENPEVTLDGIEHSLRSSMNDFPKKGDDAEVSSRLMIPKNPLILDPELLNHSLMGEGVKLKYSTMINDRIVEKGSIVRLVKE